MFREIHYKLTRLDCHRFDCATHWRVGWLSRAVADAAERLQAGAEILGKQKRWGRLWELFDSAPIFDGAAYPVGLIHVVVAPPPELWDLPETRGGYNQLRRRAYKISKEWGFRGGCAIYHGLRVNWHGEGLCVEGPHFHLLGDGWIVPPARWKRSNWIIRNLGLRRSLCATLAYCLSHATRLTPKHRVQDRLIDMGSVGGISPSADLRSTEVLTWFGTFGYNQPLLRFWKQPEGQWCPECERHFAVDQCWELHWLGGEPPPDDGSWSDASSWRAVLLETMGIGGEFIQADLGRAQVRCVNPAPVDAEPSWDGW